MKSRPQSGITTLEEAYAYVLQVKTCLVYGSKKSDLPSLWDACTLPERQPGEKGWGQRVTAVWAWKNELPELFPDEIFYGKLPGGLAMLMCMTHFRDVHYPAAHRPVSACKPLARRVFALIRREPRTNAEIREALGSHYTKNQVDRALVELQTTLNIVRSHAPGFEADIWVCFTEQFPDFANDEEE